MCKFSLYSYKTHLAALCSHRSYAGHVNWSQHQLNVLRPNAFWYTCWNNMCPPPCVGNRKCANYAISSKAANNLTVCPSPPPLPCIDLIKCTSPCLHSRELDCVPIHASVPYLAEYSLVQFIPTIVYPGLHEQLYPPSILMHVAL